MSKTQNPILKTHHRPLDRSILRGWGVPAPWIYGIGFRATFGDLDAQNHVSNVIYLRWIEAFRVHYLRDYGWRDYATENASPMVIRKYEIDYIKACHLNDDIVVTGKTVSVGTTSCTMHYAIWRNGLVAEAKAVLVFLNKNNEKSPIPGELKSGMIDIDRAKVLSTSG